MEENLWASLDFNELNGFLDSILSQNHIGVEDLLKELIAGDFSSFLSLLGQGLHQAFFGSIEQCRDVFLGILLLGIFAILLNNISDLFSDGRIALFSRYFVYLFVSLLLLRCFAGAYETAMGFLKDMQDFMAALMPVFCIALGLSNGTVTAIAHYEFQLLLLFLVERLMIGVLLPLVQVYCILHVMNQLPEGNRFGGVLSLIKKAILFITKSSLFVSLGGSMLQAAIMPAVDGMKSQLVLKAVSFFPGLGDYANAIGEMVLRGAILVKNSVGVLGILLLLLMCIRPVITTLLYGCVIRLASALLQVSGEKRFTDHIWKMADSFFLLARIQLFGGGVFFVSIAVAAVAFYRR